MRNRIERLRLYLAVGAGLLLLVLIGFIGTARYLKRHALARLGSKLGVDIRSETNGFTYSQSLQGRTVYTIHAAKEIEHANGVIGLHDVSMIIYGRTGDRADKVYGNEFEYDKNAGEVRAIGLVHIDLGGAGSGTPGSAAARALLTQGHDEADSNPKLLHATTSGLVYLDKLGVAATKEAIDFESGQMKGHAVGADYNTDSGMLQLHSDVNVSAVSNGRPVHITAATAQLDDRGQRTTLSRAHYVSAGEVLDAAQAILHTRPDNSLERIEADGDVHIDQRGAQLTSAHADVSLNGKNKPQSADFTGNVQYSHDTPLRQARGEAQQVHVSFDPQGSPLRATFTGAVHMIERTRPSEDPKQPWAVRNLVADAVDTTLAPTTPGSSQLRDATARGNARLTLVDNGAATAPAAHGRGTTELAGDTLTAHLLPASSPKAAPLLDTLTAQGHTELRQLNPEGVEQTSTGDALTARFRPAPPAAPSTPASNAPPAANGETLASAVQSGHLHMVRTTPAQPARAGKPAAPAQVDNVTAQRATYDGDDDRILLTGGVRLEQTDSLLLADGLTFDRATGDAHAQGAVRVSYTAPAPAQPATQPAGRPVPPPPARDPVHILAERADMRHADDQATFYGRPVRLWQSGSQLQAPVIELSRQDRTLSAHADSQPAAQPAAQAHTSKPPVQTILVNAQSSNAAAPIAAKPNTAPKPGEATAPARKTPQIIRILSNDLFYSDADRKAQFNGSVEIQSADETVHSRAATAWLQPATTQPPNTPVSGQPSTPATPSLDGRLDRVLAAGDVVVEQPGRRATGTRLLYLAPDASVLLTGAPGALPKVVDTDRGTTVTAVAFRLHTNDDSVEALSSLPDDPTLHAPVHTETPARR